MDTITNGDITYRINLNAVDRADDSWRAILYKGQSDRTFRGYYGTKKEVFAICNAGNTWLLERASYGASSESAVFWAGKCDSDDDVPFGDFWSAAEHILTYDKQNGGVWTADAMLQAIKLGTTQTRAAMIDALISIDVLDIVDETETEA